MKTNPSRPFAAPQNRKLREEALGHVIAVLGQDPALTDLVRQNPVPTQTKDQRQWVQALLTVRPAGVANKALFQAVDTLLSLEKPSVQQASDLADFPLAGSQTTRFAIWQGDITTLATDAIVNAANAQMLGCFQPFHNCIDNAIHCAAGPRLREACFDVMSALGRDLRTGEAKVTPAYHLPSQYVVHTVGPIVQGGAQPSSADYAGLAHCYSACLSAAAEQGARTLAFCGISTGVYGFPKELAVGTAVQATRDWVTAHPDAFDVIVFNTFDADATQLYHDEVSKWL